MHKCVNNTIGNVYHLEQMVDNFFPYSQKQLGFDKPATMVFQSDEDNASRMLGKTAYYDPETFEVVLYTDGRHPKDVMRSLSHELVHHAQNCRGDFTSANSTEEGYAQNDPHLRRMEREAYTKGNLIFRDFEDLIKTGKINIEIDFSDSGEPKMSLKEWKNNEINTKLMQKWGLLKEEKMPMKTDVDDADGDGETDDQVPAFLKEDDKEKESEHYGEDESADKREEEGLEHHIDRIEHHLEKLRDDMGFDQHREDDHMKEGIFAPNHYCVHHGGVQHEGQIKMAEAISHNFDKKLNKVTWYDMKLQDGTILEQVAAEDIQVTSAVLESEHGSHRVEDEDDPADFTGTRAREKKAVSALKHGGGLEERDKPDLRTMTQQRASHMKTKQSAADLKYDQLLQAVRDFLAQPGTGATGDLRSVLDRLGAVMTKKANESVAHTDKITVAEAKEITRRIIERIKKENN